MTHAVRLATKPMLDDYLKGHPAVEFWTKTDSLYGASERTWPNATYESLVLAEHQWRREIGRIVDVSRQTACIVDQGQHFCIVKLHYDRVAEPLIEAPSPSGDERADSSQTLVDSGVDRGEAAVRGAFGVGVGPSMCWKP